MFELSKIGTDGEVFLEDITTHKVVSAVGKIGGTKWKPRPIDDEGSALQEDNVMCEFNVIPTNDAYEFVSNINLVLAHVLGELREKNLTIRIAPSAVFPLDELDNEQAQMMGCDPDFDAWEERMNPPLSARDLNMIRTCGGHVHISYRVNQSNPTQLHHTSLIRALDLYLGVPSVLLDDDILRKKFYGKAGAFRIPAHNRVEYRTLSNFWYRNDTLKAWVFNNVLAAMRYLNRMSIAQREAPIFDPSSFLGINIPKAINNKDKKLAAKLIKEYQVVMP